MQQTIGVTPDDVAGVKPAAAPGGFGCGFVIKVGAEEIFAWCGCAVTHQHLAVLAIGQIDIVVINHAHLDAGLGSAKGARAHMARHVVVNNGAHHFSHAPDFNQGKAESVFKSGVPLRLHASANRKLNGMVALMWMHRLVQQHRHHYAEVMNHGGPGFIHLGPPARGLEAVGLNLAIALEQGAIKRKNGGVDMEQRQRVVEALAGFAKSRQPAASAIPHAGSQFIAV